MYRIIIPDVVFTAGVKNSRREEAAQAGARSPWGLSEVQGSER